MSQHEYQPISTIKISAKEKFYWVKYPSPTDPDRLGILQSYVTSSGAKIIQSLEWQIEKILSLDHPHLQSVGDVFATENSLQIVQELDTWDRAIDRVPYTPAEVKTLLQEIIPALIYLHDQGISHGNISPETIVVNQKNKHILINSLVISDLINKAGGDTILDLRSQLEKIPVLNMPTGQEWDLYSLGVTMIALLTNKRYHHLYDTDTNKWNWKNEVDCSEELIAAIDRLLGKKQLDNPQNTAISVSNSTTSIRQVSDLAIAEKYRPNPNFYRITIGALLVSILGFLAYLSWGKFQNQSISSDLSDLQIQPFPNSKILIVGYINRTYSRDRTQSQQRDYPKFKSYLEAELRKQYGNDVKVQLESVLTAREAQANIKQKKWDLAFTFSANNAIVAEDNKYEFIARMSATEDPYRDVCFFVRQDSNINSSQDFTPELTIALPNDDSPIFTMPLYDLYGKKMRISYGNTLAKIQEKVKSGEANVGVDFCKRVAEVAQFRALSPNRVIPVGGVFLSPRIEGSIDRNYIREAIVKAPESIQLNANYTRSSGINYDGFRRINERAKQLLDCVDLTRNPVNFYCPKQPK